jgi:hypothetical protein
MMSEPRRPIAFSSGRFARRFPPAPPPRAFVAIDVETGDYEVDENDVEAMDRLAERTPEAEGRMFLRRVGSKSAYHFGGRFRLEDEEEEEL